MTWLLLSALTGLLGAISGAPPAIVIGAVAGLWLPVLAALLPPTLGRESHRFQVLAWTVVAVCGLALSGGVASPLTILLALPLLTALSLGRPKLAMEAAAFSALGFFSFWLLGLWFAAPRPPASVQGLITAVVFAAVIHAGVLAGGAVATLRRKRGDIAAGARTNQDAGAQNGAGLPRDLPLTVVSVSPEGRVRSIQGDQSLPGNLRVGQEAAASLGALAAWRDQETGRLRRSRQLMLPGAGDVQVERFDLASGLIFVLRPFDRGAAKSDAPDRVEKAVAERTAFFAGLGHELKTPLNAIIGFSDMMRSGIRGPLPEAYQDYSELIGESGQDLLLLVEDILDLAKADSRKLEVFREPVDLAASGEAVRRQMELHLERADITLLCHNDGSAWADADVRAVRQIWQNLLSNAIKYTGGEGEIIMATGSDERGVYLSVEDFGAGMDEDDLAIAGARFAQGANARGRAGTGLGLAVVKEFADLLGAQVTLASAPGEGTKVEVLFQRATQDGSKDLEKAAE